MKDLTKELTIEQKAKRYDEAIDVARKIKNGEPIDVPDGTVIPVVIFPELEESDDEKIRKVLVGFFKNYKEQGTIEAEMFNGIPTDKILAWFEKQGKQEPIWNEYDEHKVKDIIYYLNEAKKQYASTIELEGCIHWLWSLLQRMG